MLDLCNKKIILASASPRRKELLAALDIPFEVRVLDCNEDFPEDIALDEVALYLARKKAAIYYPTLKEDEIIITADTTVIKDHEIFNKAINASEARKMLQKLSGGSHQVITGVCLISKTKEICFDSISSVTFKVLDEEEIAYYVEKYKPYDKAGAYGIQEWIGYIAIEKIVGSYYTIMGLPVHRIYEELKRF